MSVRAPLIVFRPEPGYSVQIPCVRRLKSGANISGHRVGILFCFKLHQKRLTACPRSGKLVLIVKI
jgi:hypothetical protein